MYRDFGAGRWVPRDHIVEVTIPVGARAGTRLLFPGLGDELPPTQQQQRQQRQAVSGCSGGGHVASPGSGSGSGFGAVSRDLVLVLQEAPNVRYVRRGDDLVTKAIVPLSTALGGGTVHLRRLDGSKARLRSSRFANLVPLALSEVITPDSETILIGEGMPRPDDPQEHGNMVVQFKLEFPRTLTPEQRQAVKLALQPQPPQSRGAT
ncbi:hypothetical protein VaNZ11_011379 [Volvox africanus]|uniref:Chaperone DnaJ C-terminal domain-containing protein n=1 Tax=Volvox africanus TaxID=51714 RepID=A0ABQ5SC03_9CHLO|nr:hypothetical protein VaNZ11_011379 [Volvox africanus]